MFKPCYYFTLVKFPNSLRKRVVYYMYLKDGKFKYDNNLYSQYLLTWPQAMKYKFLFWWHSKMGTSEKLIYYKGHLSGSIFLEKMAKK